MSAPQNIDPRLAKYWNVDFSKMSADCMTALADWSDMFITPVSAPNTDLRAPNVNMKLLVPEVDARESLIDYRKDNDRPGMNGNSSSAEWAAFNAGLIQTLKKHPGISLQLDEHGQATQLPQEIIGQAIEAGRVIHDRYLQIRAFEEAATNPRVERITTKGGRE